MTEQRVKVVVIGGGYAGVIAANHLRLRAGVDITLVNPPRPPDFVERIRLHQLITGSDDATHAYADILARASSWWSTPPPASIPRRGRSNCSAGRRCPTTT